MNEKKENEIKSITLHVSESIAQKLKSQIFLNNRITNEHSMAEEFCLLIINGIEKDAKNVDIKESKPVDSEVKEDD